MEHRAEADKRRIKRYASNKIIILTIVVLLLVFIGYQCGKRLSRPETNLEFWIAENVKNVDFSQYQEKYGLMGGREYYGSGYVPLMNEYGEQTDPKHCVIYTVTAYPDYFSNQSHVTRIWITDPSIEVYGLTLDSTLEEIEHTMKSKGFRIKYTAGGLVARKGKFSLDFSEKYIHIKVKVTNVFGVQF